MRSVISGVVLEKEVYTKKYNRVTTAEPRPRFENEEDRRSFNERISRQRHLRLVNENFSPSSWFVTLTFNRENEVHNYDELKKIRNNYKRQLKRKYPDAIIFMYMGRGRETKRLHMHMLVEGIPAEFILDKWRFGEITRIEHLRKHNKYGGIDRGQDYEGLANYLFDHWEPIQGQHRWMQTKNAKQPEREELIECNEFYNTVNIPPAPKGYILIEIKFTKYGYFNYRYVIDPKGLSYVKNKL